MLPQGGKHGTASAQARCRIPARAALGGQGVTKRQPQRRATALGVRRQVLRSLGEAGRPRRFGWHGTPIEPWARSKAACSPRRGSTPHSKGQSLFRCLWEAGGLAARAGLRPARAEDGWWHDFRSLPMRRPVSAGGWHVLQAPSLAAPCFRSAMADSRKHVPSSAVGVLRPSAAYIAHGACFQEQYLEAWHPKGSNPKPCHRPRLVESNQSRDPPGRLSGPGTAIERYRRGKYVVATEKSSFSTAGFTVCAVRSLLSAAQTPSSACPTRRIEYNHC